MPSVAKTLAQAQACLRAGQHREALQLCQQALRFSPENVEGHYLLGAVYQGLGQANDAIAILTKATRLDSAHADAHDLLGILLAQQGKFAESISSFQQALRLRPESAAISHNLRQVQAASENNRGNELVAQRNLAEAEIAFRRALELKPDFDLAFNNLGAVLSGQDKLEEAAVCFRRASELQPAFFKAHHNLGAVLAQQGKLEEAAACCRRALELSPNFAAANKTLAAILRENGNLDDAVACWRRAVELTPEEADVHQSLGGGLMLLGEVGEALVCLRKAAVLSPESAAIHSDALVALQYQSDVTLASLATAHREYELRHAAPLRDCWRPHGNSRHPDRRLRLGFVSPDFRIHPVGFTLIRVLENFDARQVETTCYSDVPKPDAMTGRLRAAATSWRDVRQLDDRQLADQLRADQIDIAFDLTGHTGANRLLAFARKPAPIQITWYGYVGTTGLEAMDYLLADRREVPETAERYLQERVLLMPDGYACYDPPDYAPPVAGLPAFERGFVTFGSFNNPAKITSEVLEVWAGILRRVSAARLVLKYRGFDAPSVKNRMEALFAQQGVDAARLDFLGATPHADLMRQYQRIDLALDPFPYSGCLTTCEALWMGVPVVTWPSETFAGRHSLSHLSNVGLTETIAVDVDDYVERAVALATDWPRLAALRAGLRQQMADSPLCNGKLFAENLVRLLRGAWHQWCTRSDA